MDKVLLAIQQLLEISVGTSWSPLAAVKRVFFGDPITIPISSMPALIVRPKSTEIDPRGSRYDSKKYNIEICLVYNQATYYGSYKWTSVNIATATWIGGVATFNTQTNHNLIAWDDVTIEWNNPSTFNTTVKVLSAPDLDTITVTMTADPGTLVAGGKIRKEDVTKVYAVEAAIQQAEWRDSLPSQSIADNTIAGVIQNNPSLPYISSGVSYPTVAFASVRAVDYVFSNTRGFPAYEIIVTLDATAVWDR